MEAPLIMKIIKKKLSIKEIMALIAIAAGVVFVAVALYLESADYPWGLLFGTASQSEDSLPDPPDLILDREDSNSQIVVLDDIGLQGEYEENAAAGPLPGDEAFTAAASEAKKYVVIGSFKIPSLRISQNLLEGTGRQLKYGVGYVPGTAAPGEKGNCAIAGHRSYPFRYLNKLSAGDSIIIKSAGNVYTYKVYDSFDVLPEETWVLNSVDGEDSVLTIITCTPYLVSSHRLIVRARLADS